MKALNDSALEVAVLKKGPGPGPSFEVQTEHRYV